MQLPSDPGALVMTTPVHGGVAHPLAARKLITRKSFFIRAMPADGFEPPTNGLQNRCSTPELSRHGVRPHFPAIRKMGSDPDYLMRRNVGLPPPEGFFGSGEGAGR